MNVSVDNANAAVVFPPTLTFTPQNYNTVQTVTVRGLPGTSGSDAFNVQFSSSSADMAFTGLYDQWAYSTIRSAPQTVTLTQAGPIGVSTSEDTASTAFSLGVAGATSGNTTFTGPNYGTLSWSGVNLIYTPSLHFSGTDSAVYSILNGSSLTTGIVNFTVDHVYVNPTVTLVSPANGSIVPVSPNVIFSASGYQEGGTIDFYLDGSKVGSTVWPTNSLAIALLSVGSHQAYAISTDSGSNAIVSSTSTFTVTPATTGVWLSSTNGVWSSGTNWYANAIPDGGLAVDLTQIPLNGFPRARSGDDYPRPHGLHGRIGCSCERSEWVD